MEIDPKVAGAVGRVLRGLPADLDEPQIKRGANGRAIEMCGKCGTNPVAEKASAAQEAGVCVECATWMRRHGGWRTDKLC